MMDIMRFLNENIVDIYGEYIQYHDGISEEEFDKSFIGENQETISDLDYILSHYQDIFDDLVFEELYLYISDSSLEKDIPLQQFVAFLASMYYVYHYDGGKTSTIRFLRSSSLEEIENLFVENFDFGMEMVKSYFASLVDKDRYQTNRKMIFEKGDQDSLLRFEGMTAQVTSINHILRNTICHLYNFYIQNGYDDISALQCTWQFFIRNFDPLGELDQMGYDYETKRKLQGYLLSLIYADLYEDICNHSILSSEQFKDRQVQVVVSLSVHLGFITIPQDDEMRNRLLKYFLLLQEEKEKMRENRRKTYEDGRIMTLKKVNPIYILDELTSCEI